MKTETDKSKIAWMLRSIEFVADYRMVNGFQMHANLMRPTGFRFHLQKSVCADVGNDFVARYGFT